MSDQENQGLDFTLNKPLPEKQSGWDFAAIANGLMVIMALVPVLPLIFFFWGSGRSEYMRTDEAVSFIFLLTALGACGATCALPVLIPAGWVLSHRRKQKNGTAYRWWTYVLAIVLWVVFAGFTAFQLFGFPGAR